MHLAFAACGAAASALRKCQRRRKRDENQSDVEKGDVAEQAKRIVLATRKAGQGHA